MLLETGRGEDLGLEAEVLLDSFEVSLDEVSLPNNAQGSPNQSEKCRLRG